MSQESHERRDYSATRQETIFSRNLAGQDHPIPLSFEALERAAIAHVDPDIAGYIGTGAGRGASMQANREAFDRLQILPRVLQQSQSADLSTTVLGERFQTPVMLAPVGAMGEIHSEGELATARAASNLGVPLTLSTVSSYPMEDVAALLGDTPRWFQLYMSEEPDVTRSFVERAEQAGFSAIVITVDTPKRGWRPQEADSGFSIYDRAANGFGNYFSDPEYFDRLDPLVQVATKVPYALDAVKYLKHVPQFRRQIEARAKRSRAVAKKRTLGWSDIETVCEMTSLPVVLKGVLHPADAERAVAAGVDGIVVSNHGGNHLDGAVSALEALPRVLEQADDRIDVLFDSGIRTGSDVFKALALGADMVLLGRPYLYGLAIAGEQGVYEAVANVLAELEVTMINSGHLSVRTLDTDSLTERPASLL